MPRTTERAGGGTTARLGAGAGTVLVTDEMFTDEMFSGGSSEGAPAATALRGVAR